MCTPKVFEVEPKKRKYLESKTEVLMPGVTITTSGDEHYGNIRIQGLLLGEPGELGVPIDLYLSTYKTIPILEKAIARIQEARHD